MVQGTDLDTRCLLLKCPPESCSMLFSKPWFSLDIAFFKYIEVCHECNKEGISAIQLNDILHRSPPRSHQKTCPAPQLSYAPYNQGSSLRGS